MLVRRLVPLRGGPGGANVRPMRWVRLRKRLTAGPAEKEGARVTAEGGADMRARCGSGTEWDRRTALR